MSKINEADFSKALTVGRPPNIQTLFPNSKALLVSGKYIDLAMLAKGQSICMAANGRSSFVIRGALKAAQRANSVLIIEIAKLLCLAIVDIKAAAVRSNPQHAGMIFIQRLDHVMTQGILIFGIVLIVKELFRFRRYKIDSSPVRSNPEHS